MTGLLIGLFVGGWLGLLLGGMNRLSAQADERARLSVIRGGVRRALRHGVARGGMKLWDGGSAA
jgi:hypothetical protein